MAENFYDKHYYKNIESGDNNIKCHPGEICQIEFFKRILCPHRNETILDLGCGPGQYLEALKDTGAKLWGIDISAIATSAAKKKVAAPEQILCGDACPLPFKENEFDYVTAWGVIEHFSNIPRIVSEIRRVLKSDGTAVIMVPNHYYLQFIWNTIKNGSGPVKHQEIETLYSFGEWKALIEKEGFKVIKVFRHNKFNKSPLTTWLREKFIPFYLSNHFVFICKKK